MVVNRSKQHLLAPRSRQFIDGKGRGASETSANRRQRNSRAAAGSEIIYPEGAESTWFQDTRGAGGHRSRRPGAHDVTRSPRRGLFSVPPYGHGLGHGAAVFHRDKLGEYTLTADWSAQKSRSPAQQMLIVCR